jgi:hypothetical protein
MQRRARALRSSYFRRSGSRIADVVVVHYLSAVAPLVRQRVAARRAVARYNTHSCVNFLCATVGAAERASQRQRQRTERVLAWRVLG